MFCSLFTRVKSNASSAKVQIHASYCQRGRGTSKHWLETQSWMQPGEFSTSPQQSLGLWMHLYHLTARHQETWQIAACSIKAIASCRMVCTVPKWIGMQSPFLCGVVLGCTIETFRRRYGGFPGSQERLPGWCWGACSKTVLVASSSLLTWWPCAHWSSSLH